MGRIEDRMIEMQLEAQDEYSIAFRAEETSEEVIRIQKDGKILVHGVEVADDVVIYKAMREWLITGSTFKTGFKAGYEQAQKEYREALMAAQGVFVEAREVIEKERDQFMVRVEAAEAKMIEVQEVLGVTV